MRELEQLRAERKARRALRVARKKQGLPPRQGGRPKGAKNTISKAMLNALAHKQGRDAPMSPLGYMLDILGNEKNSFAKRSWAAEKAAPYMHRKMPLAIEGGDPSRPLMIATVDKLKSLTPEEFALLRAVQDKLVGSVAAPDEVMRLIGQTVEQEAEDESESD